MILGQHFLAMVVLLCLAAPSRSSADPLDNWRLRNAPVNFNLRGVTYGSGLFVAVGLDLSSLGDTILTSPDGVIWTDRSTGSVSPLNAVAYGNSRFVAVGDAGITLASTNGVDWSRQRTSADKLAAVTYGNGIFVAVGNEAQTGESFTSSDGASWTSRILPDSPPLLGVVFGNGFFVTVSAAGTLTSFDGMTWADRGSFTRSQAPAFGNGLFVTTDGEAARPATAIYVSSDAEHWMYRSFLLGYYFLKGGRLFYGNGTFVALGDSPGAIAWLDADAFPVGARTLGDFDLQSVAYGRGTFVAVGNGGVIWQSDSLPTARLSGGPPGVQGFPLTISGEAGLSYRLQAAVELPSTNWIDLLTFTNTAPATNFVDTNAINFSQRFYRVASP